jgi:hypothetical protein
MKNDIEMNSLQKGQLIPPTGTTKLNSLESNYDIRRSVHPFACIFHLLFKAAAILAYLFLGVFISNTILQYIIVILCDAFDFWTVKNVTGR